MLLLRLLIALNHVVNVGIALLLGIIVFFVVSLRMAAPHIHDAIHGPVIPTYEPKTGDILLNQYRVNSPLRLPIIKHYPMHAGFMWVRDGVPLVVEATVFDVAELENLLESTEDKDRGIRVVRFDEYLKSCDNVVYVRRIKKALSSKRVEALSAEWGDIDFEPLVADNMHVGVELAIGWRTLMPKLADWGARVSGFAKREPAAYFCSEFVSHLLQKLGAINSAKTDHFRVAPASFLSTVGFLEQDGTVEWAKEELILRKY